MFGLSFVAAAAVEEQGQSGVAAVERVEAGASVADAVAAAVGGYIRCTEAAAEGLGSSVAALGLGIL